MAGCESSDVQRLGYLSHTTKWRQRFENGCEKWKRLCYSHAGAPPVRGAGGASEASQLMDKAFALSHSQIDLIKKSSAYQLQVRSDVH